jgi:hypothetical protein
MFHNVTLHKVSSGRAACPRTLQVFQPALLGKIIHPIFDMSSEIRQKTGYFGDNRGQFGDNVSMSRFKIKFRACSKTEVWEQAQFTAFYSGS